jgi:hypothetical protein
MLWPQFIEKRIYFVMFNDGSLLFQDTFPVLVIKDEHFHVTHALSHSKSVSTCGGWWQISAGSGGYVTSTRMLLIIHLQLSPTDDEAISTKLQEEEVIRCIGHRR